ncbi:MAG: ATP-binding protein [Candidatus Binatia bacterium]
MNAAAQRPRRPGPPDATDHTPVLRAVAAAGSADATTGALVERVRLGLIVAIVFSLLYAVVDTALGHPAALWLGALRLVVAATAAIGLLVLRRQPTEALAGAAALGLSAVGCASAAASGAINGEALSTPLVAGAIAMATGALLPWSVAAQVALVAVGIAAALANAALVGGSGSALLAMLVSCVLSIYLTDALGRGRARAAAVAAALRESEEDLRSVLESVRDLIMRLAPDGTIEFINRVLPPLRVEDVIGNSVFQWAPPEFHPEMRACFERVLRSGRPDGYTVRIDQPEMHWFRSYVAPVRRDGRVIGLTLVATEITEERRIATQQREDAEVAAALARVGRELIASLDTPALLQRLGQLATEVFGCETSHTFLPVAGGFAVVAGYGDTPEQWEAQRALTLPPAVVDPILARLRREGVTQVVMEEEADLPSVALSRKYGVTLALYLPFRKGGEIVGVQSVAFRGRRERLGAPALRLAAGIADLASLALETARLVEALGEADRLKTDFLANMSHELRTPLNVIIGYNEMLLDGACGSLDDAPREMIARVQRNARELLHLVSTALEISRYEAQGIPLDVADVSVPRLLDDLARETEALPEKPGLRIEWQAAADLPALRTDVLKLKMVLKNLLDNGIKFTERGSVSVAADVRAAGVEFRVTDTGVGIPPSAREAIFEPFIQGEHARQGHIGGVGLGLYIVRRLVEALDGEIALDSTVGAGSTFAVWIPIDRAQRPAGT